MLNRVTGHFSFWEMQCKVSINAFLLPVKVSGQTEYLSEVSKSCCPSGKVIFGQTWPGWAGQCLWRQPCPSSWWAEDLVGWAAQDFGCRLGFVCVEQGQWPMWTWLLFTLESIWPCFLSHPFPAWVPGPSCCSSSGAVAVLLRKFCFSATLLMQSPVHFTAAFSELVVTIMATVKT